MKLGGGGGVISLVKRIQLNSDQVCLEGGTFIEDISKVNKIDQVS